jgi:hypothetical protein
LLTEGRTGLLRAIAAGIILSGHDHIAFMQVAADNLGDAPIGESCANKARFDILCADQHPDHLCSLSPLAVIAAACLSACAIALRSAALPACGITLPCVAASLWSLSIWR